MGGNGIKELAEITQESDTRDVLSHATRQSSHYEDYFLVDVDAHVTETQFWGEIMELVDNDVIRQIGQTMMKERPGVAALLNIQPGMAYQNVYGRIPHQTGIKESVEGTKSHHAVELIRRAMDAMGLDYQVVFPTPMLLLGMHPQVEIEVELGNAFNRWMIERIIPEEPRIKGLLYLPFNDPAACVETVERFGGCDGVIGFTICATRNRPVHHNDYMKLYSLIEETGKPLSFHSGFHWADPSLLQLNRFLSMHAISFVHYNIIHLTNWIINGLPERFPKLNVIWVESGLAWVPFLMQRLDHEYLMRVCEAPLLKRMPSDYIRDMYFTSQPLERNNMKLLAATFEAIDAENKLLFSSDWPHWDFDPPSTITSLPFLSEQAKRNILGLNAAKLFNLEPRKLRPASKDVLSERPNIS